MTTMEILCCTDHNFVIPMGVMMHSLCVNNKNNELHFHVFIDGTVTEGQKKELREVINEGNTLNFYLVDVSSFERYLIVKVAAFPISIYYRLLLADILPQKIHKVLYLDADIIIRHDLSQLWNYNIKDNALAAVEDQSPNYKFWEFLNYPKEKGYFNSGVILFNLDYLRKNKSSHTLINFIKHNPDKLKCPDQDALNYVFRNNKELLPLKYNVMEGFYRQPPLQPDSDKLEEAIMDPYILHFNGDKPWQKRCHHPLKNLYYVYRRSTPWNDSNFMERFKHKRVITRRQQLNTWIMERINRIIGKSTRNTATYKDISLNK